MFSTTKVSLHFLKLSLSLCVSPFFSNGLSLSCSLTLSLFCSLTLFLARLIVCSHSHARACIFSSCVHTYICIYIYVYVYIYICIYICIYIHVYIYIYICIYVFVYIDIYIYLHTFRYILTGIYTFLCKSDLYKTNTYSYTYMYANVHTPGVRDWWRLRMLLITASSTFSSLYWLHFR